MKTRTFSCSAFLGHILVFLLLCSLVVGTTTRSWGGQAHVSSEKDIRLFAACSEGNLAKVKQLLAQGANINGHDRQGYTPLTCAVPSCQPAPQRVELVRFLLDHGAAPRLTTKSGSTALSTALEEAVGFTGNDPHQELAIVNLLLARGANAKVSIEGWTALHSAACGRSGATVRRLVQAGANLEVRTKRSRCTPLLVACCRCGCPATVRALLAAGANPIAVNSLHYNALELAADKTNWPIVEELLHHGFHVDQRGPEAETPLMVAAASGAAEGAGESSRRTVELLLKHGANSNSKDRRGNTPLMWAVSAYGIPDADHIPGTAAAAAVSFDSRKVVRLLLDKGADIHVKNKEGKTALMLAKEADNPLLVKFLKDAGAKE